MTSSPKSKGHEREAMTATDEARARELLLRAERLHEMEGSDFAIAAVAQALEAVRREALEEAAKVCEAVSEKRNEAHRYEDAPTDFLFMAEGADECADRIRALLPATKEGGNGD